MEGRIFRESEVTDNLCYFKDRRKDSERKDPTRQDVLHPDIFVSREKIQGDDIPLLSKDRRKDFGREIRGRFQEKDTGPRREQPATRESPT